MTVTFLRTQGNVEDPRWETAARCIKRYERWHGPEHHPYVTYGHHIEKGEESPAGLTESGRDSILRKGLEEMYILFRHLGKDSPLIACLAYQVGPCRLLDCGRIPKSMLARKLEAGNRGIYVDFTWYCYYKGKKTPSIERRREGEYRLLSMSQEQDSREFVMIYGCS